MHPIHKQIEISKRRGICFLLIFALIALLYSNTLQAIAAGSVGDAQTWTDDIEVTSTQIGFNVDGTSKNVIDFTDAGGGVKLVTFNNSDDRVQLHNGYAIQFFSDGSGETATDGGLIYFDNATDTDLNIATQENGAINFLTNGHERAYVDQLGIRFSNDATIHVLADTDGPTSTEEGALWLDTDAGGNGYLKCYANGGWRTVATL